MNLRIKYSSSTYSWLCFRHAVQEAMRGDDVKTEIVDSGYIEEMTDSCSLCDMAEKKDEDSMDEWYKKYLARTEERNDNT